MDAAIEIGNVGKYEESKLLPADYFFSGLLGEIQDNYRFSFLYS